MNNFTKKLNFLPGIILIIIFITPALVAKNIAKWLLHLINNFFAYFDYYGVSGGYLGMFYEKLVVEGGVAATYCAGMILLPMYLNKRFFKKFYINWLPGIILVFLFFTITALYVVYIFLFKVIGNADWIDTLSYIVGFIGYTAGYLSIIFTSLTYSETTNKFIRKLLGS